MFTWIPFPTALTVSLAQASPKCQALNTPGGGRLRENLTYEKSVMILGHFEANYIIKSSVHALLPDEITSTKLPLREIPVPLQYHNAFKRSNSTTPVPYYSQEKFQYHSSTVPCTQ